MIRRSYRNFSILASSRGNAHIPFDPHASKVYLAGRIKDEFGRHLFVEGQDRFESRAMSAKGRRDGVDGEGGPDLSLIAKCLF